MLEVISRRPISVEARHFRSLSLSHTSKYLLRVIALIISYCSHCARVSKFLPKGHGMAYPEIPVERLKLLEVTNSTAISSCIST